MKEFTKSEERCKVAEMLSQEVLQEQLQKVDFDRFARHAPHGPTASAPAGPGALERRPALRRGSASIAHDPACGIGARSRRLACHVAVAALCQSAAVVVARRLATTQSIRTGMGQWRDKRRTYDYQCHGTTTLFAALEIATGKVIG